MPDLPRLSFNPNDMLTNFGGRIGLNFGLLDCYTCKHKSTVMNQFKVVDVPNGMEGPTRCDIAQVREAYEELKVRVRPSPTKRSRMRAAVLTTSRNSRPPRKTIRPLDKTSSRRTPSNVKLKSIAWKASEARDVECKLA